MYNYMRAISLRFKTPSGRIEFLENKTAKIHKQLSKRLKKPERKMLLRLTDLYAELLDESSLESFVSGYRVASGIQQELLTQPAYNFEDEDERIACQRLTEQEQEMSIK